MNLTINGLPIVVDDIAAQEIVRRHLVNGEEAVRAIAIPGAADSFTGKLKAGETYVGSYCGPDGKLVHTILLPGQKKGDWDGAIAWAKALNGDLPNRIEQALLWAHHRGEFEKEAYWSNEPHAGFSGYAWGQYFDYGYQYGWNEDNELLARAVRRVTI